MNGYQLAAAARAIDPRVKILLTSGYSAGHRPGHDPSLPMLHKPYTRAQLAAHIRAALDERREYAPTGGTAPQSARSGASRRTGLKAAAGSRRALPYSLISISS